ncbi:MAG: type II toxin-antitoxin system RelE/ParE family toxin [Pirellulales bacterium]
MAVQVVFHWLAAHEARQADAWYASRSPEAATRFRAAVLAAAHRIADGVRTHPIAGTRFHYARVDRFPYRLIFCFESPTTARVIAVAHSRRRPGYWRQRR